MEPRLWAQSSSKPLLDGKRKHNSTPPGKGSWPSKPRWRWEWHKWRTLSLVLPLTSGCLGQGNTENDLRFSEVTARKAGRKSPHREGPEHFRTPFNQYKGFLFQPSNWVLILKGLPGIYCANHKTCPRAPDHLPCDSVYLCTDCITININSIKSLMPRSTSPSSYYWLLVLSTLVHFSQ